MRRDDDDGEEEEEEGICYQELLKKNEQTPEEAFFELANNKCVRYHGKGGVQVVVQQRQDVQTNCGGIVWESAFALADYLSSNALVKKRRFSRQLELGSGTGMLGIYLHKLLGIQKTVLTDTHECILNLKSNVQLNKLDENRIAVEELDWTNESHLKNVLARDSGGAPFDLVFATDVLYSQKLIEPLIRVIDKTMDERGSVCYVCSQPRDERAFEMFQKKCASNFGAGFRRIEEFDFKHDSECVLFEIRKQ